MSGQRLIAERYRLQHRIGSGAMGVVWQAVDERLGRIVAVKQVMLQAGLDETAADEGRQRMLREGRIAARLQHPHAISLFDVALDHDDPWLVMEYLPSRSLAAVLAERGALPAREVARIGQQVADALDAAHAAGVVHRDVKPGNVLIGDNGTVKITDFGISRATGDVTVTRTGVLAGTLAYFAPEVARGHEPTPASDVFSLGATLYTAVEGVPPFGVEDNALALLHLVAAGRVPPPTLAGPLTALLMRLLRAVPAERPTAAQARDALARVAAGEPAAGQPTTVASYPPTPTPTRRQAVPPTGAAPRPRHRAAFQLVVAMIVVAALGGVLLAVALTGGQQSSRAAPLPATTTPASTTAAPPTSAAAAPTTSVPVTPAAPSALQLEAAVRSYYQLMPDQTDEGWTLLGPRLRARVGGFGAYQAFWSTIAGVQVLTAQANGTMTVRTTLLFRPNGRLPTGELHELGLVRGAGGQLLIDSDALIGAAGLSGLPGLLGNGNGHGIGRGTGSGGG